MKYDFTFASDVFLPDDSLRNEWRRRFGPCLYVNGYTVLNFVQGDYWTHIAGKIYEASGITDEQDSVVFIRTLNLALETSQARCRAILRQDQKAMPDDERYHALRSEYNTEYLDDLAEKANHDMKAVCEDLIEAAIHLTSDKKITRPRRENDWQKLYRRPAAVPDAEYYLEHQAMVFDALWLHDYEVQDFLMDYLPHKLYETIVDDVFCDMTREQRVAFFDQYDMIIGAIQDHFVPIAHDRIDANQLSWDIDHPGWKDIFDEMIPALKTASYHITNAALSSYWPLISPGAIFDDFRP